MEECSMIRPDATRNFTNSGWMVLIEKSGVIVDDSEI